MDRKRRVIRLIETYINDFRGSAVEEMYGKGTKIKIHEITYSYTTKSILIEAVIILGELITDEVMDRALVDILIQDSIFYIYPDFNVKTYVRWDV